MNNLVESTRKEGLLHAADLMFWIIESCVFRLGAVGWLLMEE